VPLAGALAPPLRWGGGRGGGQHASSLASTLLCISATMLNAVMPGVPERNCGCACGCARVRVCACVRVYIDVLGG